MILSDKQLNICVQVKDSIIRKWRWKKLCPVSLFESRTQVKSNCIRAYVTPSYFCFAFYSLLNEYFNKTFTKHEFVILSF